MTRDIVLHTAGVLPGTMAMDAPCVAEQAAVAAAQAAVATARMEFEAAKAALDEAERQNNLGQTEESYRLLQAAANRQGAGRLNLEIAEKHLDEAKKALADCLGSGLPLDEPPVVLTPSDTVLHTAGVIPGIHVAGEFPPDPPPVVLPPPVLLPPSVSAPVTEPPVGVYPDYSSGDRGPSMPFRPPSRNSWSCLRRGRRRRAANR